MDQLAPDELPRDARELAELLARRLDVVTGRLELIFVDGRYVDGYRQERMRPTVMAAVSIGDGDARAAPADSS